LDLFWNRYFVIIIMFFFIFFFKIEFVPTQNDACKIQAQPGGKEEKKNYH